MSTGINSQNLTKRCVLLWLSMVYILIVELQSELCSCIECVLHGLRSERCSCTYTTRLIRETLLRIYIYIYIHIFLKFPCKCLKKRLKNKYLPEQPHGADDVRPQVPLPDKQTHTHTHTHAHTHTHTHTHTHPRVMSENNVIMDYQQRCFRESQNFHLFRVALVPQPVHHLRDERRPLAGLTHDVGRIEEPLVQKTHQLTIFFFNFVVQKTRSRAPGRKNWTIFFWYFRCPHYFYYSRPYCNSCNLVKQSRLAERSAAIDPGGRQAVARCLDTSS